IAGYATPAAFPARFAQLGVVSLFAGTRIETISNADVGRLEELLHWYVSGSERRAGVGGGQGSGCSDCGPPLLGILTETYGISGHESPVREKVKVLLPEWARKKLETDAAGNLVLRLGGTAKSEEQIPHVNNAAGMTPTEKSARPPSIAFVAHMDEIG